MAPFPYPAHQTGRADLPHPAFRQSSRSRQVHGGRDQFVAGRYGDSALNWYASRGRELAVMFNALLP